VEIEAIGPAPMCGLLLADLGAEVTLVERKAAGGNESGTLPAADAATEIYRRGKRAVAADVKSAEGLETALALVDEADVLIEGFRPGVMERLGLGPEACLARNPKLVYGRQTGWGQTGPLSAAAGHDINYIALAGALYYTGHDGEAPFAPATVIGDLGGGALTLAIGILAALNHVRETGEGQVIDAAVVDGTAYMTTLLAGLRAANMLTEPRDSSLFTGAAPFYQSFECADGEYVTIGALEPKFYDLFIDKLGLGNDPDFRAQYDASRWPAALGKLREIFRQKTRDEWAGLLEGTDACFAPVLNLEDAARHPQNLARGNFRRVDGVLRPMPAPKFSKTPTDGSS
jgi:acetyl-CoA hydrolase